MFDVIFIMRDTKTLRRLGYNFFGNDDFFTNIQYWDKKKVLGELDIYGFKNDTLYLIEYKYLDNRRCRNKAMKQLVRAEKNAVVNGKPYFLIYAHGHKKMAKFEFLKHFDGNRVKYNNIQKRYR